MDPPGCALSRATSATASPLTSLEFHSTLSSVDEKTTLGTGFQIRAYSTMTPGAEGSWSAVGQ